LAEGIPLQEMAKLLGQSPSAISHRLERKFGMSYSDYLARLRMEEAKRLLRHTKLSATAIGPRVGIRDQSNFTKTFKRFIGMTPAEYREQHRRNG
jgi:two-component system response regulator YesN